MKRTLLILALATGCASPPPPRTLPEPTTPPALTAARSIALNGAPSATPELDAIAERVAATTPTLGLKQLIKSGGALLGSLRPGDTIQITVLDSAPFTGPAQVRLDGSVEFGVLGSLPAAGLTTTRLAAAIRERLIKGDYLQRPVVSVALTVPSERVVRVVGRVGAHVAATPGAGAAVQTASLGTSVVPLPAHRPLSVYDLISTVNGLGADADGTRITLIRGADPSAKGAARRCYHFAYSDLVAAHLLGEDAWVLPDDQLLVPRLPTVQVFGAVAAPGPKPLRPGSTVASVIMAAGGALPGADALAVQILNGEASRVATLSDALASGDVVYVPAAASVFVVGSGVPRGGPIVFPPDGLTVIQAIGQAGWFGLYGDRDGVMILRTRDGKQESIAVPIEEILKGTRPEQEFMLRPGDTVFVPEAAW